jgi:hypothetical protein
MPHRRFTHFFRRRSPAARIVALAAAYSLPRLLHAQTPALPTQEASSTLGVYRTPLIALVQPANGGAVPRDKPVVVFRFAQGEPNDAIDTRSLVVSVDGVDVTAGFQIVGGDAWGPLADATVAASLGGGPHQVLARICSARGTCGTVSAVVSVTAVTQTTAPPTPLTSKRGRIMDLVVRATKLLLP